MSNSYLFHSEICEHLSKLLPDHHYVAHTAIVGSYAQGFYNEETSDIDVHCILAGPLWNKLLNIDNDLIPGKSGAGNYNFVLRNVYDWLTEIKDHTPDAYLQIMSQYQLQSVGTCKIFTHDFNNLLQGIKETVNTEKLSLSFLRMSMGIMAKYRANHRNVTEQPLSYEGLCKDRLFRMAVGHFVTAKYLLHFKRLPETLNIVDLLNELYQDTCPGQPIENNWWWLGNLMVEGFLPKLAHLFALEPFNVVVMRDGEPTKLKLLPLTPMPSKIEIGSLSVEPMIDHFKNHFLANGYIG